VAPQVRDFIRAIQQEQLTAQYYGDEHDRVPVAILGGN
jgi:hypothetical protein